MTAIEAIEADLRTEVLGLAVAEEQLRKAAVNDRQARFRADVVDDYRRRVDALRSALRQARVQAGYGLALR